LNEEPTTLKGKEAKEAELKKVAKESGDLAELMNPKQTEE